MSRRIVILLFALTGCHRPDPGPAVSPAPRHPMAVTCFDGAIDSGRSCTSLPPHPWPLPANVKVKTTLRCGDAGARPVEVEWDFVGHRGDADVYLVTHRIPVGEAGTQSETKVAAFAGERVVVFRDASHCVVLDPPRK